MMGSEGATVAALAVDGYPRNVPHAGKTSENSKWHVEGTAPLPHPTIPHDHAAHDENWDF